MTSKILMGLSASVLALGACGQTNDTASNADMNVAMDNDATANNMAATPLPTSAQGFANTAAASDRFEIESSKLAESAAQSTAVKDLSCSSLCFRVIIKHGRDKIFVHLSAPMKWPSLMRRTFARS